MQKITAKRTTYTINGSGQYSKNQCALEIVKLYLKKQECSYVVLKSAFDRNVSERLVKPVSEIEEKFKTSSDRHGIRRRWFTNESLKSIDGVSFYVSRDVGDNCPIDFQDIVSFAASLGYIIKQLD